MDELRFDGRVAIITGAGRGLGEAYAHLLAARGAAVVVNDLGAAKDGSGSDPGPANVVVEAIRGAGGRAVADGGDVTNDADVAALVRRAVNTFGRLDIVVNNAGIIRAGNFPEEVDRALLQRHLDVHLLGAFSLTRAAWPHLQASGTGRVVMTSSAAIFGDADIVAYSAAKAGVLGLTRSLALAGAADGIIVNAVAPLALTRMAGDTSPGGGPADESAPVRLPSPRHAAAVVAFLAHEACRTSGELYNALGGFAGRVALVTGEGHQEADLTPEAVAEHWDAINDLSEAATPLSMWAFVEPRSR